MPRDVVPIRLAYKIIDSNTGTVIVPDLFHIGNSQWTVRALLPGYPGSTTLGDFRISLPAPYSEEFRRYRYQYNAILTSTNNGIGLRVEGYLNDVNSGTPVVSGVITKMELPLDGPWVLSGVDTLWWLQQSQMLPGELYGAPLSLTPPTTGLEIVQSLSCTQEIVWSDDFRGWNGGVAPNSGSYNNVSGWTFTSADPYLGLPALVASSASPSEADIVTTTSWNYANQYSFAWITIHGTIVTTGTSAGVDGNVGILILSDSNAQNTLLFQISMVNTSPLRYSITLDAYERTAGVFNTPQTQTNLFTNVGSPFHFELSLVFFEGFGEYLILPIVNGQAANFYLPTLGPASTKNAGRIGFRQGVSSGVTSTTYVNRLEFKARTQGVSSAWATNRFQAGSQSAGPAAVPIAINANGQTHLDMLVLAGTIDGFKIRKNPKSGYKSDTIDYSLSPGTDLSTSIVFEEGVNIKSDGTVLENVAEIFSTDVRLNSVPTGGNLGGDTGGFVLWGRIGAIGDMVLTDTATDIGTPNYALLLSYAKSIQERKASPIVATQVNVIRTSDITHFNNGWGPRELDFVTINLPTYGIINQRAQIVGYTFTEGNGSIIYFLTQFPENKLAGASLQKLIRTADYVSSTYQSK